MTDDRQKRDAGEPISGAEPGVPAQDGAPDKADAADENARRPLSFSSDLRKDYKPHKKGRLTLRILALAGVAAVVVFAVLLLQDWRPVQPEVVSTEVVLMQNDRASIESITIALKGEEPYTVTKSQKADAITYMVEGWPDDVKLNQFRLGDVYTVGASLAGEPVEENPEDLARYGLDDPTCEMTVRVAGEEPRVLLLGTRLASGLDWYLMEQGGDTVYRVADYAGTRITHTPKALHAIDVLPTVTLESIDYLLIERRDGASLEIRLDTAATMMTTWRILKPEPFDADYPSVSKLAEQINAFALTEYVDTPDNYAPYGLDDPRATVMLKDNTGARLYFSVGDVADAAQGTTYVRLVGEKEVYTAKTSLLSFLDTATLASVVDRFAAIVNIANVDSLSVNGASKKFDMAIARKEQYDDAGKVKLLANGEPDYLSTYTINGTQVDEDRFKKLYQALIGIQVQGEVQGEVGGEPAVTIRYVFNDGTQPVVSEYIPYQKDFYAIRQNGNTVLFYTRRDSVNAIEPIIASTLALPLSTDASAVTGISIDLGNGDVRTFSREGGVATYMGKKIDSSAMDEAYAGLAGVSAQDVAIVQGAKEPMVSIEYTFGDGRAPVVVEFRDYRSDLYSMAVRGHDAQFLVSKQLLTKQFDRFEDLIAGL